MLSAKSVFFNLDYPLLTHFAAPCNLLPVTTVQFVVS